MKGVDPAGFSYSRATSEDQGEDSGDRERRQGAEAQASADYEQEAPDNGPGRYRHLLLSDGGSQAQDAKEPGDEQQVQLAVSQMQRAVGGKFVYRPAASIDSKMSVETQKSLTEILTLFKLERIFKTGLRGKNAENQNKIR